MGLQDEMGSSCKQNSWKLLETWKLYSGTVVRAVNNYCSQIYDSLWLKSPVGFRHKLDGVMKLANCNMCWKFKRWCKSEYWEPHLVTSSVLFLLLWFLQHWMLWYHEGCLSWTLHKPPSIWKISDLMKKKSEKSEPPQYKISYQK